jgi:MFS family permease
MGLGIGPISPIVSTAMHERVSVEMRGRVFGAWFAIATATIPLGILVTGLVVETVGIETTLYVLAAAYLGVIASAILNPAIRAIEEPMASASIQEAV